MIVFQPSRSDTTYRPEIDGLRALAVTAVLLFHFYPELLPYGYLGVDLFFVISGYLISLYILEDVQKNSFSLIHFYVRRIKRILPVTFLVLFCTLLFAFLILIGSDFDRFLKSLIATLMFTANIFFWGVGGYFGTSDALKPLLHMWSLGVEEQFYLIFPCLFVAALRRIKSFSGRLSLLTIFILLSFIGYLYLIHAGGENPAFFLTPFRAWQFGIGSVAALLYHHHRLNHRRLELIATICVLILGLFFFPSFVGPGFLVSMATAYFLSKNYVVVNFIEIYFSSHLIRKIGLISFSLYLWHWPILVFIRYVSIESTSEFHMLLGILLTFILSYASYRFVEEPFRRVISISQTIQLLIGVFFSLMTFSFVYLYFDLSKDSNHPANQLSQAIQSNYRCPLNQFMSYGGSRACLINQDSPSPYHVALMGNSHAQMYTPALEKILHDRGEAGLLIPLNGCLPTTDINISKECLRLSRLNFNALMADTQLKVVIFSLTWYGNRFVNERGEVVDNSDNLILAKSLIQLMKQVKETGRSVFLIGPINIPGYDLPSVLSRKVQFLNYSTDQLLNSLRIPRTEFDHQFKESQIFLGAHLGKEFLRPDDFLCDADYCYFGDLNGSYFADSNHLSNYGVAKMNLLFSAVFGNN